MDERRLAEKLKARSRPALDQAVRRLTPYVGTVICRTLSGRAAREDVEELTADVFLALWEHAPDLDPAQGLRPWLAAVARNRAVDFLRRQRFADPLPEDAPAPGGGPEDLLVRREWAARLWAAVEALGEPDRTLFFRYYYENAPLGDAAEETGLSLTAAKQRLFRGRKKLKAMLSEGADD